VHSKHELGHANTTTGYYSYYKDLLPIAYKNISNAFWTISNQSFKMKKDISTTVQVPLSIRSMLFDLRSWPVFNPSSVITQTVPDTFYQIVNTMLSLVWLLNTTPSHNGSTRASTGCIQNLHLLLRQKLHEFRSADPLPSYHTNNPLQ